MPSTKVISSSDLGVGGVGFLAVRNATHSEALLDSVDEVIQRNNTCLHQPGDEVAPRQQRAGRFPVQMERAGEREHRGQAHAFGERGAFRDCGFHRDIQAARPDTLDRDWPVQFRDHRIASVGSRNCAWSRYQRRKGLRGKMRRLRRHHPGQ